jgi:hypothetical protein
VSSKKEGSKNYLDYIPVINRSYKTETKEDGYVTIYVEKKGLMHKIAQKIFRRPYIFQFQLEEIGSFIWRHIDGRNTIYEIGQIVHEYFGEKAEPLYPRLIQYFQSLQSYDFIRYKTNPDEQAAADTVFFEEDREVI